MSMQNEPNDLEQRVAFLERELLRVKAQLEEAGLRDTGLLRHIDELLELVNGLRRDMNAMRHDMHNGFAAVMAEQKAIKDTQAEHSQTLDAILAILTGKAQLHD